jgi:heme-degrading monooxygenase HmoA
LVDEEMAQVGEPYQSGRWLVNPGSEDEFIERWTTFTQWSLDNAAGTESFVLLRDSVEPRRFLSIGTFESHEAVRQWRERPEFSELRNACIELCEEFEPHEYTVAASPSGHAGAVSGVTDTVGGVTEPVSGVTDTVGGATDSVRGVTDNLLGGGGEKQR